ncbi:hypothetical protein MIMGU_mgv1a025016mg [Erythranthe guttata]|uniref:Bulb-type lectin domain-containing protein n=1 Tax=Erythranthe guttata TaxID=4155 RepID=A0A022QY85_ERYGU|nr:hypothetical protein MIMGU_mgv1a025016mg [Erythranthe guttata]
MYTILREYGIGFLIITASLLSSHEMYEAATDTINTSRVFRDNGETLISAGGSFELGFFHPANSDNRYVGIWYKKVTVHTVVWVANREIPLTNTSGTMKVVEPGILVLVNDTNGTIWSTNTSRTVQNPIAQLLDSGNLSFDHPTDTLLPGMKLGKNFVTGLEVYMSSQKSISDPAKGEYTFHCDPTGYPQNILKKGESVIYRTGPWDGIGFSGNPNLRKDPIFTYGLVISKNEVYYHYELINNSVISRFTLNENGLCQRSTWVDGKQEWAVYLTVPTDNCDHYENCGPYDSCNVEHSPVCGMEKGDWSNGCVRSTSLNCAKGDGFLMYSGVKLPDTRNFSWYNESMNLEEFKLLCSKNCSCMAYTSLDISRGGIGSGCLLWFGDLVDIRDRSPGQDIHIRVASSELGRTRLDYVDDHPDISRNNDLEIPQYDLPTLIDVTENFSIENKLGEGGFGPFYKVKNKLNFYGYMSPEYAIDGVFSVKLDVFSFGVLVLEIVSGKRNRGFSHRDHRLNLLGYAWMLNREERSLELVDSYLISIRVSSDPTRFHFSYISFFYGSVSTF